MYNIRSDYDMPYRQSQQGFNAHYPGHASVDAYSSPAYTSKRETPGSDLDSKTSAPRKRVPVACDRCRKRKIKCSGDQGDGSGCDNCKTVGWTECQFLRVRSAEVHLPQHPQTAPSRYYSYRSDHRYHPYAGGPRHHHCITQSPHYPAQLPSGYPQWSSAFEFTGLPSATTPLAWNATGHYSPYSAFDPAVSHAYSSLPPSYMITDIDTHDRGAMYMNSVTKPQQQSSTVWLDTLQTATLPPQMSCVYPLTPAESTKSYCGIPGQHALSNERSLPIPGGSGVASLPAHGQDTPPLSAASHRSSNPWDGSVGSTISSRTSCGGNQDQAIGVETEAAVPCEDQAVIYPYVPEDANPQIHLPATALPIDSEQLEIHASPLTNQVMAPEPTPLVVREKIARESGHETSSSNCDTLYGYSSRSQRSSNRRAQRLLSSLYTGGFSPSGSSNYSPSPNTRHPSSAQLLQNATDSDVYQLTDRGVSSLTPGTNF